jgi:hypothetical protein
MSHTAEGRTIEIGASTGREIVTMPSPVSNEKQTIVLKGLEKLRQKNWRRRCQK